MIALAATKRVATVALCLAAGVFLCSCATPYRPLEHHYGYSDSQVGKDEFEVTFLGNADTSYERAFDFAQLRAAEIALKHQARSFTILDVVNLSSARRYMSSSQYYWTASPYLSTGGAVPLPAPDRFGAMTESYQMVVPGQERIFYKPGLRLKIRLSPSPAAPGSYDPAKLAGRLKHKHGLK